MKNTNNMKSILLAALSVLAMGFMSSCQEDVVLKKNIDQERYDRVNYVYGSIINTVDSRLNAVSELRTSDITIDFRVDLTKKFDAAIDATMKLDATLVDGYNSEHKTKFGMLPAELVSFEEAGAMLIAPGDIKSVPVTVTIKPSNKLAAGTTYIVPIAVEVITDGVRLDNLKYVLLVKYIGVLSDCTKSPDFKVISVAEVNDVNPLNHLEFSLKSSKKLLFDIVVLFSANVRYDEKSGKVHLWCNDNISALLSNRDHYLKPLQDRGMKVVLGVLGDRTIAGVANMSQPMAAEFASELKSYCDAYNLDGIYFDDEYSSYPSLPQPGFVAPSQNASARLVYETKRAMPDKLTMVYMYAQMIPFQNTVDGVDPGMFIDYGTADYGKNASVNSYKGITLKQLAPYSQEYARGNITNKEDAAKMVADGFGANMIFSMNPYRDNFTQMQMGGMGALAKGAFNDELVYSKVRHEKDWK